MFNLLNTNECLEFTIATAKKAGNILIKNFGQIKKVEIKESGEPLTIADLKSEEFIISRISDIYPKHGIISEEGQNRNKNSDYIWFVDPLDGTTNYYHNVPFFCVSIGLEYKGQPVLGVVYDPIKMEMFSAVVGRGAYLKSKKITVSTNNKLRKSIIAAGFPSDKSSGNEVIRNFANIWKKCEGFRRDGSAALDLCYVASGRYDGFWELNLKPWDTAAGMFILQEADGLITDILGNDYNIFMDSIVASNGLIHKKLLHELNEKGKPSKSKTF